jgi:hypothetical protein
VYGSQPWSPMTWLSELIGDQGWLPYTRLK